MVVDTVIKELQRYRYLSYGQGQKWPEAKSCTLKKNDMNKLEAIYIQAKYGTIAENYEQ